MSPRRSILIVDESEETREVLRTAFAGHATEVYEAARLDDGLRIAELHHPDVVVLDADTGAASNDAITRRLRDELGSRAAPVVLLGKLRRIKRTFPAGEFISKPYHYGPLIRKIEELLAAGEQRLTRSA